MKPCFPVLFAGNQADFREYRTHYSLDNLTKQRASLSRSAYQLEQLVGKQSDDAKPGVEPDLLGSPHHHVATPKLFFSRLLKRSATVRSLYLAASWEPEG